MSKKRYPVIYLRSKNEIAKRVSSKNFKPQQALEVLNNVLKNFDDYWYDSKRSEPEKEKYVRSAVKSPALNGILKLINKRVLLPHDHLVPNFIFGGLSGRNNIQATRNLIGKKRDRILLKLDIKSFYEQVTEKRVYYFFKNKCKCRPEASRILASLCCVPKGPKGSGVSKKILARGFATSSRLAMWCNLDTFQHLAWKVKKKLKNNDAKIAIYVDDIGITASRIDEKKMEEIKKLSIDLLQNKDQNQPLPSHTEGAKTKIITFKAGAEHLGIKLGRNKLSLGWRARSRADKIKFALKNAKTKEEKIILRRKYRAYHLYKRQVITS